MKGEQLKIDFEAEEREKEEIAKKYGIIGEGKLKLVKKEGKWFYDKELVEKWAEKMDELNKELEWWQK